MTQGDNLTLLQEKTEARLREIAGRANGVMGLWVVDLTSRTQFGFNENNIFPQASAIKVPVLMEVYKQAGEGKFKLSDTRRIQKADMTPGSGILCELGDGTVQLTLHDLCVLMIVLSDNTATNLLIDLVGVANVNRTMESLGLKQTRLQRRMMDMPAAQRGDENLSTPAEAARVMELLFRGEFISRAACDEILTILKKPKQTGLSVGVPGSVEIAGKPGGIAGVKTEWAIVLVKNRPYIATVMENYGSESVPIDTMKEISQTLHRYFLRLSHASAHGVYVAPPGEKQT
jgi:beta-lactamase class A